MAQRTAFLNSDAKGFNKDFHHTWINNYMLKQPGVMFSNYTTKPEFALGNGQISGGKAIIRCTRTTGTFAGEEILACFESTSTESISTAGNKKVYIEIPEVYVNDSTAITDSLTQGANLNVGRIVSSDSYPTHSNYIKLWEISNGDWQNATDLRPEVLRRGKPNTLSYFGGNGEEERIDIDNASLNKYLMSNGAGVAPSWEEGGGGGGGSSENFKRTFTADEDIIAKSMFGIEAQAGVNEVNSSIDVGTVSASKAFFSVILNGESFDSLTLNLAAVNSPADSLSVRIETLDNNGLPSGTLVDVGAYGTVTPTSTATDTTVNLSGTIQGLTAHTKVAVVLERTGSTSSSNYFTLGCIDSVKVVSKIYIYGVSYQVIAYSGCVNCDGFADEAVVQATSLNGVERVGYCETGANAGNDFTGILQGTVDYTGAVVGTKYYLSSTGTLSTEGTSFVGVGLQDGVLQINKYIGGQSLYDAIVAADGSGDYTSITDAIAADNKKIYVKSGTYTMSQSTLSTGDFKLVGEDKQGVQINITHPTRSSSIFTMTSNTSDLSHSFLISNVTFNIIYTGSYGHFTLFDIPDKGFLSLNDCNIRVVSADNGCNFYICDSFGQADLSGCYIELFPTSGNPQGLGFLGINGLSTCTNSTIIVDAAQTIGTSGLELNCTPTGTFISCKFLVGKTHDTAGDVALMGCSVGIGCSYESSYNAQQRLYGNNRNSSFSQTGIKLTYDSNLNTAVTSKKISIWKPNTSYTVGQYVMSGNSETLARCKTAHTSGTTFDATKFDNVYGDTFINGNYDNCSFSVWGTTIIGGIATYYSGVVQPASQGNITNCQFRCHTSSSTQPNYCNIVVLSNRGFVNNRVLNDTESISMHIYLGGECSTFIGNRIMSALGDVYAGGYGNIICNNIFTYITGGTAPTITEVTSGGNQIANNVIRGVADWES